MLRGSIAGITSQERKLESLQISLDAFLAVGI